jgi:hypothetical protein
MIATLDQIGINEATQYYDATLLEVICSQDIKLRLLLYLIN